MMSEIHIATLQQAIKNNLDWCQTIADLHSVPTELRENIWQSKAPMALYFPDIITLNDKPNHSAIQEAVDRNDKRTLFGKDAFHSGDFALCQFTVLFEAQWYSLLPEALPVTNTVPNRVYDGEQLKQWGQEWDSDVEIEKIYPCALLSNPDVLFTSLTDSGETAGVTAFSNGETIGLYNLFGPEHLYGALLRDVIRHFGEWPMIGYGEQNELKGLAKYRPTLLGPLSVWAKFE